MSWCRKTTIDCSQLKAIKLHFYSLTDLYSNNEHLEKVSSAHANWLRDLLFGPEALLAQAAE